YAEPDLADEIPQLRTQCGGRLFDDRSTKLCALHRPQRVREHVRERVARGGYASGLRALARAVRSLRHRGGRSPRYDIELLGLARYPHVDLDGPAALRGAIEQR